MANSTTMSRRAFLAASAAGAASLQTGFAAPAWANGAERLVPKNRSGSSSSRSAT